MKRSQKTGTYPGHNLSHPKTFQKHFTVTTNLNVTLPQVLFINGTFSELNIEQGFSFAGELKPADSHKNVQKNKIHDEGKELVKICINSCCLVPKPKIYLLFDNG